MLGSLEIGAMQPSGDAVEKFTAALDRQAAGGCHHDGELVIG